MKSFVLFCLSIFGFYLSFNFERDINANLVADCSGCITSAIESPTIHTPEIEGLLAGQFALMPEVFKYVELEQSPIQRKIWYPKIEYFHATKFSHFFNRKLS